MNAHASKRVIGAWERVAVYGWAMSMAHMEPLFLDGVHGIVGVVTLELLTVEVTVADGVRDLVTCHPRQCERLEGVPR